MRFLKDAYCICRLELPLYKMQQITLHVPRQKNYCICTKKMLTSKFLWHKYRLYIMPFYSMQTRRASTTRFIFY